VSPQQTDVIEHHYKVYERLQNIRAETEEVCVKLKVFNTAHFSRDQSEISLSIYKLIKCMCKFDPDLTRQQNPLQTLTVEKLLVVPRG